MLSNPYAAIESHEPGRIGCSIRYFEEVDSTQEVARALAAGGAPQGTAVIAETQMAGRGRMGRAWHSPPGVNLYTTIILRPSMPFFEVPRLSLVAGVAVDGSGALLHPHAQPALLEQNADRCAGEPFA